MSGNRVRAVGKSKWMIIFVAVSIVTYGLYDSSAHALEVILWVVINLYCMLAAMYNLIHSVYLSTTGIECFIFGRCYKLLPWDQISQICIIQPIPFTMKTSGPTSILIIPEGCAHFESKNMSGLIYLIRYHGKALLVDNSKDNISFIKKQYGEIEQIL